MTTQPPAPSYVPTDPGQPRKTGTVALVFGIILCVIALPFTIRFLSLLLLSMVRADAYALGMAIGALIGVAIFALPGIFLIRRFARIRRENRGTDAAAAAAYGYPAAPVYGAPAPEDAQYPQDAPPAPPVAPAAEVPAPPVAEEPTTPVADSGEPAPQQPPVPPADPNAPRIDPEFPSMPPIAPPR